MTRPDDWPAAEPELEPETDDTPEYRRTGDGDEIADPLDDDNATEPDR